MNSCVNATSASLLYNVSCARRPIRNPGPLSLGHCYRRICGVTARSCRSMDQPSWSVVATPRAQPDCASSCRICCQGSGSCRASTPRRRSGSACQPDTTSPDMCYWAHYPVAASGVLRPSVQTAGGWCDLVLLFAPSGAPARKPPPRPAVRRTAQPLASSGRLKEMGACSISSKVTIS